MKLISCILLAAVVSLSAAAPAVAGWELVDADGTRTLLQAGRLRSLDPADSSINFSFDSRAGVVTAIYPAEQLYAQATVEEICDAFEALRQRILESMSAEERQMMEEFMRESQAEVKPPEVEVEPVGTETVADIETRHYRITVDGEPFREVWLSPVVFDNRQDGERLMEMTRATAQCTTLGFGRTGPRPEDSEAFEVLMREGWPLKSVQHVSGHHDDGEQEPEVDTETVKSRQRKIYAAEFDAPPNFGEVSLLELLETEMLRSR